MSLWAASWAKLSTRLVCGSAQIRPKRGLAGLPATSDSGDINELRPNREATHKVGLRTSQRLGPGDGPWRRAQGSGLEMPSSPASGETRDVFSCVYF
ncbi:hypothetical protein ACLOJK_034160 [Asimina triloba]